MSIHNTLDIYLISEKVLYLNEPQLMEQMMLNCKYICKREE